ncbi:MAG: hypothetical protein EXR84_11480 [Gammaproteobacteria bacterium]|nr:hypothetical protein [Gammaproteobacteria bacterium]
MTISMHRSNRQKLSALVVYFAVSLLALTSPALFAQSATEIALAPAGHLVLVSGDVVARDTSGSDRPLTRKSAIFAGETL